MKLSTIFEMGRVKSYIKYQIKLLIDYFGLYDINPEDVAWKAEVIVFRGLMCPQCKEEGKCVSCGCSWNGISQDMELYCNDNKWQEVGSKKEWEAMKEKLRIKIGLVKWEGLN